MLRVLFFDLGGTLVDENHQPFPGVQGALSTIGGFEASNGKPLLSSLVSDFHMVPPPITAAKIKPVFQQYLAVLEQAGLRDFFEPVDRRVTLSTHAGALKPSKAIFEHALRRLRSNAKLTECLLVTENAQHLRAVRDELGMQGLRFGESSPAEESFTDWSKIPAAIARLVGSTAPPNVRSLLDAGLADRGIEVSAAEPTAERVLEVTGKMWRPISIPGHGDLQDVHVAIPVRGTVRLGDEGRVEAAHFDDPTAAEVDEVRSFVESLAAHDQIAGRVGKPAIRPTHQLETDKRGLRKLVRKGFSAVS